MLSVRASLSRLVFKAAMFRAVTAKLQGRDRLLFAVLKRFKTDFALNRLHAWIFVTVLPKKRHVSLTPTGKATKHDAFIFRYHFVYTQKTVLYFKVQYGFLRS